jgi:hypothetical protein
MVVEVVACSLTLIVTEAVEAVRRHRPPVLLQDRAIQLERAVSKALLKASKSTAPSPEEAAAHPVR